MLHLVDDESGCRTMPKLDYFLGLLHAGPKAAFDELPSLFSATMNSSRDLLDGRPVLTAQTTTAAHAGPHILFRGS